MLDHIGDGVYFVDRNRQILFWNEGAFRITGYEPGEVVGRCCQDNLLQHVDECGQELCRRGCPLSACMGDGLPREALVALRHKDGRSIPVTVRVRPMRDRAGRIIGAIETFNDDAVRAEIRRQSEEAQRLAYLDAVTQLPNRHFIEKALKAALEGFVHHGKPFGVLLLDVDQLKRINDAFGHVCGDRALHHVASALTGSFRPTDVVGRWGGDEFVAVVHNVRQRALQALARRCVQMVSRSAVADGRGGNFKLRISVGATLVQATESPLEIIQRADELMYRSKATGRIAAD